MRDAQRGGPSVDLPEPLVLEAGRPMEQVEYCIHVASAGAGIRHRLRPGLPAECDRGPGKVGTTCQPRTAVPLAELVGQDGVVESLELAVQVALEHDEPLGHVLLSGPPGLGKTTLARAVARDLGTRVHCASGALVRGTLGIVQLLAGLGRHDVLFIDEIHTLPPVVAAVLYEALTDFRLSLMLTSGAEAKTVVLRLPPFTLIGATTHPGMLPLAFLSCFEHLEYLGFHSTEELVKVVRRAAERQETSSTWALRR